MLKLSKWLKENPRKEKTAIRLICPLSKTDPRFKHYVTSCMSKHRFETKDDVVVFLGKSGLKQTTERNLYAYKCMYCNGWHFSSHNKGKKLRKLQSAELVVKKNTTSLKTFRPDSWGWKKTKQLLNSLLTDKGAETANGKIETDKAN